MTLLTRAVTGTAIFLSRASRAFVYLAIGTQRKAAGLLDPAGRIFVSYIAAGRPHPMLARLARLSAAMTRSDWGRSGRRGLDETR